MGYLSNKQNNKFEKCDVQLQFKDYFTYLKLL